VRKGIYDIMHFWLEKGVDGFRMDAITLISKQPGLPNMPENASPFRFYANGPRLHEFLREMHDEVLRHYDVMTVGESWGVRPDEALDFVGSGRKELHTFFQFDHVHLTRRPNRHYTPRDWQLPELKSIIDRWDEVFADDGWGSQFLGNHDLPRMVSQWGDDRPAHREASAKLWLTFLLTMRGTPYVYQGDEIGLPNARFGSIEDVQDIEALGTYRERVEAGEDPETVLGHLRQLSRDNARVPIPWTSGPKGSFTTADTPWIGLHPDRDRINVAAAQQDASSVWHYLRRLIELRHDRDVLVYGDYTDHTPEHKRLWMYTRSLADETVLVLMNVSDRSLDLTLPEDLTLPGSMKPETATVWIGTHNPDDLSLELLTLQPYEAVVTSL